MSLENLTERYEENLAHLTQIFYSSKKKKKTLKKQNNKKLTLQLILLFNFFKFLN